jgi:hypothetical protein
VKLLVGGAHRLELLGEARVVAVALLLDLLELAVHAVESLVDGLDQLAHGLLAALEIGRGPLLELAEGGASQIQERLVVLAERLGGQGLEGIPLAQPRPGGEAHDGGSDEQPEQQHHNDSGVHFESPPRPWSGQDKSTS